MAITFKITDGDFERDGLGRLKTVSQIDLLRQHVGEQLFNSIKPEYVLEVGDPFNSFIEGLVALRIRSRLDILSNSINKYGVLRSGEERIDSVDAIIVKRLTEDPRSIKFWVRVLSQEGTAEEILGTVGG